MSAKTGHLRPVDGLLAPVVAESVAALTLAPQDAAAARLARRYAEAIDAAEDTDAALDTYGPKLLAALAALGATPTARKARAGGVPGASRLQSVRDRRTS